MITTGRGRLRLHAALACAVLVACGAGVAAAATLRGGVSADAIPLGDGNVGTTPRVGWVDACSTQFRGGGAEHAGSWIDTAAQTWNRTRKPTVQGAVSWPAASYAEKVAGSRRVVAFADLPVDQTTGIFPIRASDPAYAYDRNPNHIAAKRVSWSLPLHPKAAAKPSCVGLGPIGVLRDGVFLFDALDAAGRDAQAHEVQDACDGHPDGSSSYHHHGVPRCLVDAAPKGAATLVGYALDGYGIYVVKDARGNLPTNADLDACHGTTSAVRWNGRRTRIYHYVATLEYPYTLGCFHGTPMQVRRGPGAGPPARG